MGNTSRKKIDVTIDENNQGVDPEVLKKFKRLARKTEPGRPRQEDVQALTKMVKETPELWRAMGDLVAIAMRAALNGFPAVARVSIQEGVERMKREYGFDESPSMERMQIDFVIISWIQLQKTVVSYEGSLGTELPIPRAALWEHRMSGATARYLKAIETLSRIRKLRGVEAVENQSPTITLDV